MNIFQLAKKRYRAKVKKHEKQYELKKRRTLIRKQNQSNTEMKPNEKRQKRQNSIDEDFVIGRFFELETPKKIC